MNEHISPTPSPERQPSNQIDDLVTVDSNDRGHRPDGKFMSNYEMDQVSAHQDLIREGMQDRDSTNSSEQLDTIETAITQEVRDALSVVDMPDLSDSVTQPSRLAAMRSFFGHRSRQLSSFTDRLFARQIDGINFDGKDMIRAYLHPRQIKRNLLNNLSYYGFTDRARGSAITNNPVLRIAAYKQAQAGNKHAAAYLKLRDGTSINEGPTKLDYTKEALAFCSGYQVVRLVGMYAIAGIVTGRARNASGEDLTRLETKLAANKKKIQEYGRGFVSYNKRKSLVTNVKNH